MLPTKGYFQDIECPYFNSLCGRPYCHFRHRKKHAEQIEQVIAESEKETAPIIPTYKPTPKSQLANIQNNRSHIPISYVPDLAFRTDKKLRYTPKIENPVYKPTPLSILSSANKSNHSLTEETKEDLEVINEIKQNIANVEYDPAVSLQNVRDIDFEDLSNEFELIDEIINSNDKNRKLAPDHELQSGSVCDDSEDNVKIENNSSKQVSNTDNSVVDYMDNSVVDHRDNSFVNHSDNTEKVLNTDNSKKTENSSKQAKQNDVSKKREKSNVKSKTENREKIHDKESSNHKKHKRKEQSSSPSSEKTKNRDKSIIKEKHKSKGKDSKRDKEVSKKDCNKHRERHKSKESDKTEKGISKSTNKKSHSWENHDKPNHRKNKEKEKPDHKESSQSGSKEHTNSREKSDHKESKEQKGSKDYKKQKHSEKDKDKDKVKEIAKYKETKHAEINQKKLSSKTQNPESNENQFNFMDIDSVESDSDNDVNEDETMEECYRIFNEYSPTPKIQEPQPTISQSDISTNLDNSVEHQSKRRIAHPNIENSISSSKITYSKPKTVQNPGQTLSNRYKLAKLAQATREQELLMNEIHQPGTIKRPPPPSLLEAARERKKLKEMEQHSQSSNLIDDILKGSTKTISVIHKTMPKKIAPAQNVLAITKAKERISKINPLPAPKTVAQTQKGNRVAHVPDISLSDIPDVLQIDRSKLPVNVRTRFLTMIADECIKLYISRDEAYTRALKEEFTCYEKCKVLTSYRNSAMLAVNRLRKEVHERTKNGLGLIGVGEEAGEASGLETKACQFYNKIKHWVLTEEELDIHGYPRQSDEHGVAIVKNFKSKLPSNLDENQRMCCRCHKLYQVDDDGWPLYEEECSYHPMKKRTIRGEQTYLCCRSSDEMGCATSDTHVFDGFISGRLDGFQTTMESDREGDSRNFAVYALDCEMCYTTRGLELTRVTIIDTDCKTVYESFVKPLNPIIDYNTKFSGITKEQMDRTSTSILQVQANILHLCNSRTILVGHSLESDMKALKIVHGRIIDTAVLFPHKMGLPHKRALRALASEYLRKIIQNDVSGHDSAEDAVTCMELLKWKLKEDMKGKPTK